MISESYLKIAGGCAAGRRMISDFASGDSGQSYLFASTDTLLCECIATAAVIAENGEWARRRIVSGLCGDVLTLGENGFRAEDADTVISACRLSPAELKRRAFLLILGDTNDAAQNKLLKTLEEAPERSVFFVIAPSVKSVLPTIASRLEVIEPDAPDVESALRGKRRRTCRMRFTAADMILRSSTRCLAAEKRMRSCVRSGLPAYSVRARVCWRRPSLSVTAGAI